MISPCCISPLLLRELQEERLVAEGVYPSVVFFAF